MKLLQLFLKWLSEDNDDTDLPPRYLADRLKLERRVDVLAYLETLDTPPWWAADEETTDAVRVEFQTLVANPGRRESKRGRGASRTKISLLFPS